VDGRIIEVKKRDIKENAVVNSLDNASEEKPKSLHILFSTVIMVFKGLNVQESFSEND
jgi:hypothetical protein